MIYTRIDGRVWPTPGPSMNDLWYRLSFVWSGATDAQNEDRAAALEIMRAYIQMIQEPECKRQRIIEAIRKQMAEPAGREEKPLFC